MDFFVKMAGWMLVALVLFVTVPRIVNPSLLSRTSSPQFETSPDFTADVKGSGVLLVPDAGEKKSSKSESSLLFYIGGGLIAFAIWGKRKFNNK